MDDDIKICSYIGFLPNPCFYGVIHAKAGYIQIYEGFFTRRGCAYDIFFICGVRYHATLVQRLCGTGDVIITLCSGKEESTLLLPSVRGADDMAKYLQAYSIIRRGQRYRKTRFLHHING